MLYEVMKYCRNFFPVRGGYHDGAFVIESGSIDLPFAIPGEYLLIEGSKLNDGVYTYPMLDLQDEEFSGTITELSPDTEFLELVAEIEAYQSKYGNAGPYQSESFGGYSYSRAQGANGAAASWQTAFQSRLKTWRKI